MMLKIKGFEKYFKAKKIVYTYKFEPAEFVQFIEYKNGVYVRITFTNKIKYEGHVLTTDVKLEDVWRFKKLPSPFKKGCYNLLRMTAKPVFYNFK